MFTGIIQSTGHLKKKGNIHIIEVLDNNFEMIIGDSIAVDGICLTVKEIFENSFSVDVSEETLNKTTLGKIYSSKKIVNLEPALRLSDRLGGHIVSGHVDGLGEVVNIDKLDKSWLLSIKWQNRNFLKYIVNKGSICVNGISLTVATYKSEGEIFTIAIIPHTWNNTNLQFLSIGQVVNLEADALIKYVEKLLISKDINSLDSNSREISSNWLRENGWNA
ncbi:MAG: riboflavin synthase [Prochlorococcus sp. SP3034]|nr:riboflavin synthase [Prochlorococcus sp. SP3034]|tara:strand:- start:3562 stop:4221 length:660 start_codon:yes stop_codon:yes gene_type:complete